MRDLYGLRILPLKYTFEEPHVIGAFLIPLYLLKTQQLEWKKNSQFL